MALSWHTMSEPSMSTSYSPLFSEMILSVVHAKYDGTFLSWQSISPISTAAPCACTAAAVRGGDGRRPIARGALRLTMRAAAL